MTRNWRRLQLGSIYIALSLVRIATSQSISAGGTDCCGTNLMDATGLVAIETNRILVTSPQTFLALRIRACKADSIAVQIWRRLSDNSFQFRWQTQITPVILQTSRTFITINLDSSPLQLTPDDRLGLYTPMSSTKISVPFRSDSTAQLYLSSTRYSDFNGFTASSQTSLDDLLWPRTFNDSVIFCRQAGCTDLPVSTTSTVFTSTTTLRPTTSGGPCCPTYPVMCDPTDVTNTLNNQTGKVIELQNTINVITKIINDLFTSRQITGTCPTGFTSGAYGVGKCYVLFRDPVPMALAVLKCRDYFQARLVAIESVAEELFLKSFVGNYSSGTGIEQFWTSGMYNRPNGAWYWYDDSTRTRTSQIYTNWLGGIPPVPTTDTDVCSTLNIDIGTKRDYWQKQYCIYSNYYICELPKTCL